MILGSAFSGIGGIDLGFERAGCSVAWQIESDPSCAKVLEHRFHGVKRYGDIRAVEPKELAPVDCLAGGFPCQGLSVAGKRLGLREDPRSALFFEFVRLAEWLRPKWLLIENVPGLLGSHRGADFAVVLHALDQLGYGVAWRVLDAQHFGVPQRRRRVFVVGHLGGPCPPSVLFEPEGGGRDPEAGGEAREGLAGTLGGGSGSRGWASDTDRTTFVAGTLRSNPRNNSNPTTEARQLVVQSYLGTPEIGEAHRVYGTAGPAPNLKQHPMNILVPALALRLTANQRWDLETETLVAHTLRSEGADASEDGTGSGVPVIPIQYVEQWARDKRLNGVGLGQEGDPSFTLDASYPHGFGAGSMVRRLTPRECERLQGFPDDWTLVDSMADSPRYRMLGNAVAVPVAEWIGRRMLR